MQVCMQPFGEPGRHMLGWMVEWRESLLRILLGGVAQWPESVGDEEAMEVYRQMCGRATCGADKCAKNYLVAIWKLRESVVVCCGWRSEGWCATSRKSRQKQGNSSDYSNTCKNF